MPSSLPTSCLTMAPRFDILRAQEMRRPPLLEMNGSSGKVRINVWHKLHSWLNEPPSYIFQIEHEVRSRLAKGTLRHHEVDPSLRVAPMTRRTTTTLATYTRSFQLLSRATQQNALPMLTVRCVTKSLLFCVFCNVKMNARYPPKHDWAVCG